MYDNLLVEKKQFKHMWTGEIVVNLLVPPLRMALHC